MHSSIVFRRTPVSMAVFLAIHSAAQVRAQEAPPVQRMEPIAVSTAEPDSRVDTLASPKYVAGLRDIPQTIVVVPQKLLEEQGPVTFTEALRNVPGITLQVGEGGAGSGDFIRMRGFDVANDIAIDGFADSLQYTRSDLFNVEQIEVTRGPSSAYAGAGAAGGVINTVSKSARLDDFMGIEATGGSNATRRVTLDANEQIDAFDGMALRLNLMYHDQDVERRDRVTRERWGVAPSLALGLDGPTRLRIDYFHQEDDNLLDYGIPFLLNGERLPIDLEGFYGVAAYDTEEQTLDRATVQLEHDFTANLRLVNATRYSRVERFAIWSTPQNRGVTGTPGVDICAPDCTLEAAAAQILAGNPQDAWFKTAGPQGIGRDSAADLLANYTNLRVDFPTGAVRHTLVTGVEIARENYERFGAGVSGLSGRLVNLADPDQQIIYGPVGPNPATGVLTNDNSVDSLAVYAFDTLRIGERWVVTGGLRWEQFEADIATINATTGVVTTGADENDLVTGQLGVIFKPRENGSIYVSYADSKEPPAIAAIGTGTGGNAAFEPQENRNYELGTKWDVLDARLALTAAVFRTERVNEPLEDSAGLTVFTGKRRVQGLELGAAGRLTDRWDVFAGYSFMDTEVLEATDPATVGESFAYAPRNSFSLWTTYDLTPQISGGFGSQYFGSRRPSETVGWEFPSYWLLNLMAEYRVTEQLGVRINVNNLSDEEYFERPRVSGSYAFAVPGEGRHALLSIRYDF